MQPKKFGNWVQDVTNNNYLDDTRSAWFYNDILHNLIHSLNTMTALILVLIWVSSWVRKFLWMK